MINRIKEHALSDEISRPASNRTVRLPNSLPGQEKLPVRYKNFTEAEMYQRWKELETSQGRRICSESRYKKVLKTIPNLKKARKETDKCGICFEGKKSEKKLQQLQTRRKRLRTKAEASQISKLRAHLRLLARHREENEHQRAALKQQKEELKVGEVLIHLDFKANIIINQDATTQVSKEFYQNCQRTLFGAVLYYKNNNNGPLKHVFYDLLSTCTSHNSFFVGKALQKIASHKFFRSKRFKSAAFWLDNAPNHFKTRETFYYLYTLPERCPNLKTLEWNFFIEYHGKSVCDSR